VPQVWQNTGDRTFLAAAYPYVVKAAEWQIAREIAGGGFPANLQNTYDYLGLDAYPMQV
jgi:uncharacterized protein (DUF608 family)